MRGVSVNFPVETVHIYQTRTDGKLSWPSCLLPYRDGLPISVLTRPNVVELHWLMIRPMPLAAVPHHQPSAITACTRISILRLIPKCQMISTTTKFYMSAQNLHCQHQRNSTNCECMLWTTWGWQWWNARQGNVVAAFTMCRGPAI